MPLPKRASEEAIATALGGHWPLAGAEGKLNHDALPLNRGLQLLRAECQLRFTEQVGYDTRSQDRVYSPYSGGRACG